MREALSPVGGTRLADEVAGQIRRLIVEQGLEPGARLPSERDLAATLRASRTTVSQALRALSLRGLVEVRRGAGAYVLRNPASLAAPAGGEGDQEEADSPRRLADLRYWLESIGAREALRHLDEAAGLESMERSLAHMRTPGGTPSAWFAADTNFHAAMVNMSGNSHLGALYESVHTSVISAMYQDWVRNDRAPDWLVTVPPTGQFQLHRDILVALRAHDWDALQYALRSHHEAMVEHMHLAGRSAGTTVAPAPVRLARKD